MADNKHPDQPNPTSENMDNELEMDLDYDEMTSQPSKNTSGPDMDNTLENNENQTELPKYRPPDDHNTDKMEPKPDDDQTQTRRSQRRHNTPNYSILAGKPLERKQNKHHHQTHQNGKDKGDKKNPGKKCVEYTKHRKELRETKKENKHLKDSIRKAGTTEIDLRNQFKELDWKNNRT